MVGKMSATLQLRHEKNCMSSSSVYGISDRNKTGFQQCTGDIPGRQVSSKANHGRNVPGIGYGLRFCAAQCKT